MEDDEPQIEYSNLVHKVNSAEENNNSLLWIPGFLENIDVEMKCFLDSGATISIIAKNVVKKFSIPVLDTKVKIKTADNNVVEVTEITDLLKLTVHNNECKMQFLVVDHDDHDILLGLDWFKLTGAGIYPLEKVLKFPSKKILMNTDVDMNEENEMVYIGQVIDAPDIAFDVDWDSNKEEIISEEKLSKEQNLKFRDCMNEVKDVMAYDLRDLKSCNKAKHYIKLKEGTEPIFQHAYRNSIKEREHIKQDVEKMLECGIIELSESPWSSPVVVVAKKDGSRRFCVDYRKVNY